MRLENFLPEMQAFLKAGSIGHGAFLFLHNKRPLKASIVPAKIKTSDLCSETQINPGIFDVKPARTAPMPRLTKSAGSAQQSKVPVELKSVRKERSLFGVVEGDIVTCFL